MREKSLSSKRAGKEQFKLRFPQMLDIDAAPLKDCDFHV